MTPLEMRGSIKILFDAFFSHDTADEHEMNSVGFVGIRERSEAFEIYATAGKQPMLVCKQVVVNEELMIFGILEENTLDFLKSEPVKSERYLLCESGVLDGYAKTSDISHLRHIH